MFLSLSKNKRMWRKEEEKRRKGDWRLEGGN
jgi:hypothetical protein